MTDNHYQPLNHPGENGTVPNNYRYRHLLVAVILPVVVSVGALFVVPQFLELFRGFNAEPPLGTRVLVATYRWWGVLPISVCAMWWVAKREGLSPVYVMFFGVVSGIALFVFGVWACYAPIVNLAGAA